MPHRVVVKVTRMTCERGEQRAVSAHGECDLGAVAATTLPVTAITLRASWLEGADSGSQGAYQLDDF